MSDFDSFNDEIDEYMWLCDKKKEYKRLIYDQKCMIRYVEKDIRDIIQIEVSFGELSHFDAKSLRKKKMILVQYIDELMDFIDCFERYSGAINMNNWTLNCVFNQ